MLLRKKLACACASFISLAIPAPGSTSTIDPLRIESLSAIDLFTLADEARAAGNIADASAIYDALSKDPHAEIRAEARFRKAMMLAGMSRYTEAAVSLRALLDEKPHEARVRLELARILALIGDESAARRELRQVQSAGLPPNIARVVDQFANALRSTKPIGGNIEFALAPDNNINRATKAKTLDTVIAPLDLSEDARARSGMGLRLSGQGYARLPIDRSTTFLPRLSGSADLYQEDRFNDMSSSLQLGVERILPTSGRLVVSAGQSWRWYGGAYYVRTGSISLDWLQPTSRTAQIKASISAAKANYRLNDLQDGHLYNGDLGYEKAFTPQSGGSVSITVNRQTANDPGYATRSLGAAALYFHDVGRVTIFGSASVRRLEGDDNLFLFPERRKEWFARTNIGATFRQATFHGLAPVVRISVERNRSNVGLYDYRRSSAEMGFSRAF